MKSVSTLRCYRIVFRHIAGHCNSWVRFHADELAARQSVEKVLAFEWPDGRGGSTARILEVAEVRSPSDKVRVIRLPGGHQVRLAVYVRAWKALLAMSPEDQRREFTGWSNQPDTGIVILWAMRYGLHDRINRHIAGYGQGRKWGWQWQIEAERAARDVNTPRLVVRWVPADLLKRLRHRLADAAAVLLLVALAVSSSACAGPLEPCPAPLYDNTTGQAIATIDACAQPRPCPAGHACYDLRIKP